MKIYINVDTADSVRAAVQCGADAVIIRVHAPGVRGGINAAQLPALAEYCRNRKVEFIVRQFAPVLDSTLTDSLLLCAAAARAGADAMLVSDLGFYRAARQMLPDFPFYADVGLNIHSTGGVQAVQSLGMELAVIGEELFYSELNAISLGSNIQFIVMSRNYHGNNINELKNIKKLNLLIECERPADPEYVAALTELYVTSFNVGVPVPESEIAGLLEKPLPVAAIRAGLINVERREVFLTNRPRYKGGEFVPPNIMPWEPHGVPKVNVRVRSVTQLSREIARLRPNVVYVPADELLLAPELLTYFWDSESIELCAVMPEVIRDSQLGDGVELLRRIHDIHIPSVLVSNIGHIKLAVELGFKLRGGTRLAASNSQAIYKLGEMGFISCEICSELNSQEIAPLYKYIDCEVNSSGHRRSDNPGLWSVFAEFTSEGARECAGILQRILS